MNLFELLFGRPVSTVNSLELSEKLKNGKKPLVIDVRRPDEYRTGHIPGAKPIPLNKLGSRLNELPRDREIVVVRHSGNRSTQGRDILLGAGFTQATSMAGYPTVSGP